MKRISYQSIFLLLIVFVYNTIFGYVSPVKKGEDGWAVVRRIGCELDTVLDKLVDIQSKIDITTSANVYSSEPFAANNKLLKTDTPTGDNAIQESDVLLDSNNNISGINSLTTQEVITSYLTLQGAPTRSGNPYIGLQAPLSVSSYNISLPPAAPVAGQVLAANSANSLAWSAVGGSVPPSASGIVYVAKYGSDITGDGSLAQPFASIAKAVDIANNLSSSTTPITILVDPGIYVENNSAGPLAITAERVSLTSNSTSGVIITPSDASKDLFLLTNNTQISRVTFHGPLGSTASAFAVANVGSALQQGVTLNEVTISTFNTGITVNGGSAVLLNNCIFNSNATGINNNNVIISANDCIFLGKGDYSEVGVSSTGSGALIFFTGGIYAQLNTAFSVSNNCSLTLNAASFEANTNGVFADTGAMIVMESCSFANNILSGDVTNIQVSGISTIARITGCDFSSDIPAPNNLTALKVSDSASVAIAGGGIKNYKNGLIVGTISDTATTSLEASALFINNCTHNIIQNGASRLIFTTGMASSSKISINDSTNVTLAYFDVDSNSALQIGKFADVDTKLLQACVGTSDNPQLDYYSSLYASKAIGYTNKIGNPSSLFALSSNNSNLVSVTNDRTKTAGLRLVSDQGLSVGGTSALRGWDINKNATSAELSFKYQNTDANGQTVVPQYTVMQLDGLNNQLQLPDVATKIIIGGDTNLYRSAANSLKTDSNFIVPNPSALQLLAGNNQYVGLQAPATVNSNYSISLPSSVPTSRQILTANPTTPTNMDWVTLGGSALPSASKTIYVAKYGNDTTGDGSYNFPYLTLSKAIQVANGIASVLNPVQIVMAAGNYIENNSAGPLTITADGISIRGGSVLSTKILPSTFSNDLLQVNKNIQIDNLAFAVTGVSSASAITISAAGSAIQTGTVLNNVMVTGFNIGVSVVAGNLVILNSCVLLINTIGLATDNVGIIANNTILGGSGVQTGVFATGANAVLVFTAGVFSQCNKAFSITNNAALSLNSSSFKANLTGIEATTGSKLILQSAAFTLNSTSTVVNIYATGVGTNVQMNGCIFNNASSPTTDLTAIKVTDSANCNITGGEVRNYTNALVVGATTDSAATQVNASSLLIKDCTNDLIQRGSATFSFDTGIATGSKIAINDPTNVRLSYFDPATNNSLHIGRFTDQNTRLLQAAIGSANDPSIQYRASLYSTQAVGYDNSATTNPGTLFSLSTDNVNVAAVTRANSKTSGVRLISDIGTTPGGTTALRGWDITKIATSSELTFDYQNTDTTNQIAVLRYTLMQLDGLNNQLQLPNTATKIIFAGDATLYRSGASTLKTDGNLVVSGLDSNKVVTTDANKQLNSSAVTDTELGYLSGVNSSVQTQLNNKVAKAGDTMTGALQLPSGSTASPSLNFTGSPTTGFSASSDNLSLSTGATERMKVSSSGTVSINNLTSAGVVHNDVSGNLSTSLIVNADVSPSAAIADTKLATIVTPGKVANAATTATNVNTASTIVSRDSSGNFSAGTITANLTGAASDNVLKAGDTMTGALTVPAGSAASPSIKFSGSTNTGLSAATANTLSLDTNGSERVSIDGSGNVTINGLNSTGVVHTDGAGVLSTSLIVNGDISDATIENAKLATVSSANNPGYIVVRDVLGNFAANMITINGSVTNSTDVATKQYVDMVVATGFVPKAPAVVYGDANVSLSGLQTIDGVTLVDNDRVLLNAQTSPAENGIWVAHSGAWTRPADFDTGDTAGQSYILIASGNTYAGSSWICNTPTAVIGTDPISFVQVSLPIQTNGANVGTGVGKVFRNKTGNTLNFKSLAAGMHMALTNGADDVTIATDATSANTVSTIVARDGSGNFSAGTITANLTGAASANVLKAGDTMTGTLNMATQNEIRLQDASGGEYVGLQAPSVVSSSYTVSLPSSTPTARQVLSADLTTPTNLTWSTMGSSVVPANSYSIYVAKFGNDTTGDGSLNYPFLTLSKAIGVANSLSSNSTPVAIIMEPGVYTENNNSGPLSITADGVSITNNSPNSVIINPQTLTQDLLLLTANTYISNITFDAAGTSSAVGLAIVVPGSTSESGVRLDNVFVSNFNTGLSIAGSKVTYLNDCQLLFNNTAVSVNNVVILANNCAVHGSGSGLAKGVSASGSNARLYFSSCIFSVCHPAVELSNNAALTMNAASFRSNISALNLSDSSKLILEASSFEFANTTTAIVDIDLSGAGTLAVISGCTFSNPSLPSNTMTAIKVSNDAIANVQSSTIGNYTNALQVGDDNDTSSTQLVASGMLISGCSYDILQKGMSTLNFNSGVAAGTKISINDSTNVTLSFFDTESNNALQIGKFSDQNTKLLQASIGATENPQINYMSNVYGSQAIGYVNSTAHPAVLYSLSANKAQVAGITTDRTKIAGVRLVSDTAATVGATTAVRGWDINKKASTSELMFDFQNTDTFDQSSVSQYTVMQLDGFNNQVQLPNSATKLVFNSDTNLYRGSANTLKTDGNVVVAGLTANKVVTTDASKQLTSSAVSDTELGYLSGVTSSIQTQINSKVAKAGDTMTGTLTLPANGATTPSVNFAGQTTTGISATANALSVITNGAQRMGISAAGTVSINALTQTGVVHNDASGNVSTSLIVNADVDPAAAIVDTKLATISTAGKVANSATTATSANTASAIVARDASGNFSAGTITHAAGSAANPSIQFSGSTNTGISAATTNRLSFDTNGAERMNIDATGNVAINNLTSTGVVHNNASGTLSTSLIVNADVDPAAAIVDTKLATISTAGKVANSATTATSANTANAIVARDASGNFSAGTVTVAAGSAATPSIQFSGSTSTGISAQTANTLSFDTNGIERMNINPSGTVTINALNSAGVVHTNASGNLSTSLIVNADVSASAAIVDTKLATISTAGKVANSATTADSNNTASAIVARDASGNFSAGTVSANLTAPAGTAAAPSIQFSGSTNTGISAPTVNTLSFDTNGAERMSVNSTGLTVQAGTAAAPSIQFSGSTNTGISAATANRLSFDANGIEQMSISTAAVTAAANLILSKVLCLQGKQIFSYAGNGVAQSVPANSTTTVLLLQPTNTTSTQVTVTFPPNPTDGQLFTIVLARAAGGATATLVNTVGTGATAIVNPVTSLAPGSAFTAAGNGASVTYIFNSADTNWYRFARG